jgi:hypothetical protein
MNLGDFQAELKAEIKRGDSYDARLPNLIRRAARWVEQNYTFQYMRRRFEVDTAAGENVIGLPANVPIKSIIYLRFDAPDGTRYEVRKGDLSDEEWTGPILRYESIWAGKVSTFPTLFYLDGVENLVFNRPFQEVITGQGMMVRYSDFPKQPNQTHWLLQNAEGLMLRQSLLEFMTSERDDRGFQAVSMKRAEDVKALMDADFEITYTGTDIQWS